MIYGIPAEAFPPGEYLLDWLNGLGLEGEGKSWLAEAMGGDEAVNRLCIDYLLMGPPDPRILLGKTVAARLERATGISAECWLNMDAYYRRWRQAQDGVLVEHNPSPLAPSVAYVATWWALRSWGHAVCTTD